MTRINCVPVTELSDKMLGAEYRELPRICALVRARAQAGYKPTDAEFATVSEYTLGRGHVKFFFTKMNWIEHRYYDLVAECYRRGRAVNYPKLDLSGIPDEWFGYWQPDSRALKINRERLKERGNYE